jgi:VIT1/CCC1 family predicted Fe2+/Mn2+ transporter
MASMPKDSAKQSFTGQKGIRLLIQKYLRDLIYGANDGIVTTLVVISGVAGAALSSNVVLILGAANLFADGFSMGASTVLAERSTLSAATRPRMRAASRHGAATIVGFVLAGMIPLSAYLLPVLEGARFEAACGMAAIGLFCIGAGRSLFSDRPWLVAGVEMLTLGGIASVVAYAVGASVAAVLR